MPPHRFQPGNPGNPNATGRPKKRPLQEAYDNRLRQPIPRMILLKLREFGLENGATWADAISVAQCVEATLGRNHNAAKELGDRVEGKSPQRIEITDHTQRKVEVSVMFDPSVPSREQQRIAGQLEESAKPAIEAEVVATQIENENDDDPK